MTTVNTNGSTASASLPPQTAGAQPVTPPVTAPVKPSATTPKPPAPPAQAGAVTPADEGQSASASAPQLLAGLQGLTAKPKGPTSVHTISGVQDPVFESAYSYMAGRFSPDVLDSKDTVKQQISPKLPDGKVNPKYDPSYQFQVAEHGGQVTGGAISNDVQTQDPNNNFKFVNNLAANSPADAEKLLADMKSRAAHDPNHPMAMVWETANNGPDPNNTEQAYARAAGFRQLDVPYQQPPLGPGQKAVPLPLQMSVVDPSNPAWVKGPNGEIIGIKRQALEDIVGSMYNNDYGGENGASPEVLAKLRASMFSHVPADGIVRFKN